MSKRSFGFSLGTRKRSRLGIGPQCHIDRVEFVNRAPSQSSTPALQDHVKKEEERDWIETEAELKFGEDGEMKFESEEEVEWKADVEGEEDGGAVPMPGAYPLPEVAGMDSDWLGPEKPCRRGSGRSKTGAESMNVHSQRQNRKRKRTVQSRYPNIEWKSKYCTVFANEIMRHKGRGDARKQTRCSDCKGEVVEGEDNDDDRSPEFRCQECFSGDLVCRVCCVKRHWDSPYDKIE
ncbi:hypothetical protein V5O48_013868, partial [Marasmius crinis-equi]